MQTPCPATVENNPCSATKCCDEAEDNSPATSENLPDESSESKEDKCCISLVLTFQDLIDMNVSPGVAFILMNDFHRSFLPDNHFKDFWQPPRLG